MPFSIEAGSSNVVSPADQDGEQNDEVPGGACRERLHGPERPDRRRRHLDSDARRRDPLCHGRSAVRLRRGAAGDPRDRDRARRVRHQGRLDLLGSVRLHQPGLRHRLGRGAARSTGSRQATRIGTSPSRSSPAPTTPAVTVSGIPNGTDAHVDARHRRHPVGDRQRLVRAELRADSAPAGPTPRQLVRRVCRRRADDLHGEVRSRQPERRDSDRADRA